jgi:hypothetical protein
MVQATHGDARDVCALSVTARPVAPDIAAESERFWTSHIGVAAAAMLAPAVVVALLASQPQGHRDALRPEPASKSNASGAHALVGRILDAEGHPAARVSVRAVVGAAAGPAVTTDGEGKFRLDAPRSGKFRLVAEDESDGFVESQELGAEVIPNVVLVLAHAVPVTGGVLDERGAPVPRATVKSWGGSTASERVTVADDEGHFVFERTAPDATRVTVWAHGYEPSTVTLRPGANGVAVLEVILRASRSIPGRVVGPTGRPVSGARIAACEERAAEAAVSDETGSFELPASTVGCEAKAMHPRFSAPLPVLIEPGRDVVIRLAAGGAIEGAALDAAGRRVNSFSVSIDSFDPAEGESVENHAGESQNDLRGRFRLDDLSPGTYVIHADTPEGLATPPQTIEVGRGKVVRGVTLVFPKQEPDPEETSSETPSDNADVSEVGDP